MIVKRVLYRHRSKRWRWVGWFLFGFIPLYLKQISDREYYSDWV